MDILVPLGPGGLTVKAAVGYFLQRQEADVVGVSYDLVDGHTPVVTIEFRYLEAPDRHSAEFWIERDNTGRDCVYGEW